LARGGEELATNVEIKKRVMFGINGGITITDDLTGATPDEFVTDYKRVYPLGDQFAHAVGYLSQVSADQVEKIDPRCPGNGPMTPDELVGLTGLEQEYQCNLAGTPGQELIEVDTSGKMVRILGKRNPVPGTDLKTTIDYGLQIEVAKDMNAMQGTKGAAIVTDTTGQILAFYSYPTFDPNSFIDKDNQKIENLLNNPDLPLFDRVISGTFHPGSVFKPLVAIAALEEGVIDNNFIFDDKGIININGYSYTNWYFTEYGRTEGSLGLVKAIARSTDTFFYTIGQMVGPDQIAKWAKTFGLDTPTGIDIPGETHGLIPTTDWKQLTQKLPWYLGDTYHMAIGQGYVSLTPVEENTYISAIADNGLLCPPHFLMAESGMTNVHSLTDKKMTNDKCRNLGVKQQNLTRNGSGVYNRGNSIYFF
jgi:penicillin-binding protein 2